MRKNTSDQAGRALEFYPNFIEIMEFADMPPVESLKAVHYKC